MIPAYWSRSDNFGDRLTPWLFDTFTDTKVIFARAGSARLFAVGSLISYIPDGFDGTVLGVGQMRHDDHKPDLSAANVLALRGPITGTCSLYGDLGLLCGLYPTKRDHRWPLGVFPHFRDPHLLPRFSKRGNVAIDPTDRLEDVIALSARCERIVTSSLHGLILADALGLEARWEQSTHVYGGRLKFDDYHLGMIGETVESGVWRRLDPSLVGDRTALLYEALLSTAQECG